MERIANSFGTFLSSVKAVQSENRDAVRLLKMLPLTKSMVQVSDILRSLKVEGSTVLDLLHDLEARKFVVVTAEATIGLTDLGVAVVQAMD